MAKRKKAAKKKTAKRKTTARRSTARRGKKASTADMIISKSRTKAAAKINVSGDFYGALNDAVRGLIKEAEQRAVNNGRKTLRPHDL